MLIADDERLIRESLHKLMDWESVGIEVVGVAADGAVALALVRELSPQILLSDISMPEMDGIEMIAKIKDEKLNCHVIFLSAYSNFTYAQKAVKYGAFDYILKPIDEDELMTAVTRCIELIKQEKRETLPGNRNNSHMMMVNTALSGLFISNRALTRHEMDVLASVSIDISGNDLCIGCLLLYDITDTSLIEFPIYNGSMSITAQKTIIISDSERLLLWIGRDLTKEKLMREFCLFLSENDVALRDVFISNPHSITEMKRIYAECSFASLYSVLGFATSSRKFSDCAAKLNEQYPHVYAEEIISVMQQNDVLAVKTIVNRMFWRFAQKEHIYDIDLVKLKCIALLDGLKEALLCVDEEAKSLENDILIEVKKRVNIQQSLRTIYNEMQDSMLRFCVYYNSIESPGGSWLVAQALEYIKVNYTTASLREIAQKLYVSQTHLSRIFTEKMNCNFSKYVRKHRMKIARTLLLDPKYKIYDVATMVGYSNIAHFSKAFKQTEGISPIKYKNSQSRIRV
jgi:YesN/AraC family two-component response regulator